MELTFVHDIAELPQMLAFNYDELKQGLQDYLTRFEGLVVTEDGIKAAETDKAMINKTRDAIKRARIDIKKKSFDEFETKAKELESMCDKASEGIAAQLREFEAKRQKAKADTVREILSETLGRMCAEDARLSQSEYWTDFSNRCWSRSKGAWKNSGITLESIKKEIEAEIERVKKDAATLSVFIEADAIDIRTVAHDRFYRNFDITGTLEYIKSFKEEQKRIEEARAKEAARKTEAERLAKERLAIKRDELERQAQPTPAPITDNAQQERKAAPADNNSQEETYRIEIKGTREALKMLKAYGINLGITFRKLDK